MSDTVIKFENISKQYILGRIGTGTLSHDLNRWWTVNVRRKEDPYLKIGQVNDRSASATNDKVWALRDINLEVKQGEVLGIIGKNGAGKSTLLKLLSRVTSPTTGSIKAKGRLASLLEVGTGFHPEMTGRENIYMNGSIMGMTKTEITRKLDEIVDFAGVLKYVDTPVKRYSSGMIVRLGFAIAAHLEPEILVVDEVLAVGDAEFQKKAIGKMQFVSRDQGRTVLFVSHNMAAVKSLCNRGLVLGNGKCVYDGKTYDAVDFYLKDTKIENNSLIINSLQLISKEVSIDKIIINDSPLSSLVLTFPDRTLRIQVDGYLINKMKIGLELLIYDSNEVLLCKYAPLLKSGDLSQFEPGKFTIIENIKLPLNITNGEYLVQIDLTHPNVEYLARFPKGLKVITQNYMGETGISFEYGNTGFLLI